MQDAYIMRNMGYSRDARTRSWTVNRQASQGPALADNGHLGTTQIDDTFGATSRWKPTVLNSIQAANFAEGENAKTRSINEMAESCQFWSTTTCRRLLLRKRDAQ